MCSYVGGLAKKAPNPHLLFRSPQLISSITNYLVRYGGQLPIKSAGHLIAQYHITNQIKSNEFNWYLVSCNETISFYPFYLVIDLHI